MSNFDKLTNWRQRQVTASGQRGRKSRGRGQCSLRAASRPPTRDQPDDVQREEEEDGRRRQLCWHAKFDMSYLVANLWLLISGLLVLMSAKVAATTTTKCSRFAALFFAHWKRMRDESRLQRIAWLSLAFCFWHAIERHFAHCMAALISLTPLYPPQYSLKCYSPRRTLRIRRVLQHQQQQLVERALHRSRLHIQCQQSKYVYVIQATRRVCLIKPSNILIRRVSLVAKVLSTFPIESKYRKLQSTA